MKKSRSILVAEQLRDEIKKNPDMVFPAIHELCKRFDVSVNTAQKAVHILREQRLVRTRQGRRTIAAGGGGGGTASSDSLYRTIRERIASGIYKAGDALPKVTWFEVSENVSSHTVSLAMKRLAQENLIHKAGKKWLVGTRRKKALMSDRALPAHTAPVIFALWPTYDAFANLCFSQSVYTFPFFQSFMHEIEMHGIEMIHGYKSLKEIDISVPRGKGEMHDTLKQCGNRYAGGLYTGLGNDSLLPLMESFKKPIVYCHLGGEPPSQLVRGSDRTVMCSQDVGAALRCALDALVSRGHRTVGMLRGFEEPGHRPIPWIERRIALCQKTAREDYPGVTVVVMDQDEYFWYDRRWETEGNRFLAFLHEQAGCSSLAKKSDRRSIVNLHRMVRQSSPGLSNLVDYPGLTAVIAANDMLANLYRLWMKGAGISVPQDISIVGFDNIILARAHNISSVDFGMSNLGYLAAHYIIGDIPVRVPGNRILFGIPRYINRGTVRHR